MMFQSVLKLRPDITTLIIDQAMDGSGLAQMFEDDLHGHIKTLIFKRFQWYEERAEVVSTFLMQNKSIETIGILSVNENNRGLSPMFQGLQHHSTLKHLRVAINTIGQESVFFFMNCIDKLYQLETIDLGYVVEQIQKSMHQAMVTNLLNKKAENFGIKLLHHISTNKMIHPTITVLRLKGCEIGKIGAKHLMKVLKLSDCNIRELDLSYN